MCARRTEHTGSLRKEHCHLNNLGVFFVFLLMSLELKQGIYIVRDHKAAQNIYSAEAAWYSTPHQLHSSSFPFFLPFYSEQLICVCECVGCW